jgi:pyruvate,orthophosphate dikinase
MRIDKAAEEPAGAVLSLDGEAAYPPELLGHKGYGIVTMRRHGLPVPPAFCVTTAVGARYLAEPRPTMDAIWEDVLDALARLEAATSRTFGRGPCPLLVSVRSGAAVSMPGMMDTVLDLGMCDAVEQALAAQATIAFARDTRRRFTRCYRRIVADTVPDDPYLQLRAAIEAVFMSWRSPRSVAYRAYRGLDDRGGTAAVVQAMVFGNMNTNSGAGVVFSRNPMTGADDEFGEWLPSAQGDDVVSGTADVEPITALRDRQPGVYDRLAAAARTLERINRDVQEVEFTVEDGTLWLLQTRTAKRSAQAAVRVALRLCRDGLIDDAEALRQVSPAHIQALLRPSLQPQTRLAAPLLAKGLPAGPGVASGRVYTEVDAAVAAADNGDDVILVRNHTSPEDIHGMLVARGIVTETGGATSHAAVVSRELGRVAVVGCGPGIVESLAGRLVTVDGNVGEVRDGILPLTARSENDSPELRELAEIARRLGSLHGHAGGDHPVADSDAAVRSGPARSYTDAVSDSPLTTMLTALRLSETDMRELTVLQAVRLKGRIALDELAATLGEDSADVAGTVEQLTRSGSLVDGATLRISPDGRARLSELLSRERERADTTALAAVYDDFRPVNAEFMALVTDWQVKDGKPNTHEDHAYDAAILVRLDRVHQQMMPIVAAAAAQLPRLGRYAGKLESALRKLKAGDLRWLSRPIIDSYHTVWFELHEELLLAAGLTREDAETR